MALAAIFAVACGLAGALGCAPKQRVPLDVTPAATAIYLDGKPLEGMPSELKLRSDQDHVLFFKSEGHASKMVVLESGQHEGKPRLLPAEVRLRLNPLDPTRRRLIIESGDEASDFDSEVGPGAVNRARSVGDD